MPIVGSIGRGQGAPDTVVSGTGGFTVPAGKFGYFAGNVTCTVNGFFGNSPPASGAQNTAGWQETGGTIYGAHHTSTAATNAVAQWLTAGDSITVLLNAPFRNMNTSGANRVVFANCSDAYAKIQLNATDFCTALASGNGSFKGTTANSHTGAFSRSEASWSFAQYTI